MGVFGVKLGCRERLEGVKLGCGERGGEKVGVGIREGWKRGLEQELGRDRVRQNTSFLSFQFIANCLANFCAKIWFGYGVELCLNVSFG